MTSTWRFYVKIFPTSAFGIWALLFCFHMFAPQAQAQEKLNYGAPLTPSITLALELYSLANDHFDYKKYQIALVDLNLDGLPEIVLKSIESTNGYHEFSILNFALNQLNFIVRFPAKDIAVSDTLKNGMRNLLVYEDNNNDFRYTTYIWDSTYSQYIIKDSDKTN